MAAATAFGDLIILCCGVAGSVSVAVLFFRVGRRALDVI